MSDGAALVYLEADDEVTSVVRRVRQATEPRVVLVAPGRSRAISSVVVMRLLARAAAEEGREIAVVGDALTRSLAAEAALPAYATVDDARNAATGPQTPTAPGSEAPRRAGIHVVRGQKADETAPTMAAVLIADPDADPGVDPGGDAASAETLLMRSATPAAATAPRSASLRRLRAPLPLAVGASLLGILLLAGGVAAVALLPAATVVLVPRDIEITAARYQLTVEDAERREGTAEASATVIATGTYDILEAATGVVVFLNWNSYAVRVPAGTLVAAGQQAFETLATIDVESGRLTPDGRIQAGEGGVAVVAAAPGPAANVPVDAIDTVLNSGTAAELRGFQNNNSRLVVNPEPTSGGVEASGPEITQQDIEVAVARLVEALREDAEGEAEPNVLEVPATSPAEPVVAGLDGLVGMRDLAEVEITGSLAYDEWLVDLDAVRADAEERLSGDLRMVPVGYALATGRTVVTVVETVSDGRSVTVTVEVAALASPLIDEAEIRRRVAGMDADEAERQLSAIGDATVRLWPDWAETVPGWTWRIEVVIEESAVDETQPAASTSTIRLLRP